MLWVLRALIDIIALFDRLFIIFPVGQGTSVDPAVPPSSIHRIAVLEFISGKMICLLSCFRNWWTVGFLSYFPLLAYPRVQVFICKSGICEIKDHLYSAH